MDPIASPTGLFIDGAFREGTAGSFPVLNPSTGEALCQVSRAGAEDLDAALAAASRALPEWRALAPRARAEILRNAFDLMIERRHRIARMISLEMGKPPSDAGAEIAYAAEFLRWFSEQAVRIDGTLRTAPSGANKILTFRRPVGVALLLTPWNFPAAMATRKIAPALAAGCTVVLKPAEDTPLTALLVAQVLADAGVPPGVVNVVLTDQPAKLVEFALLDSRVRKLSFTGSTEVGRILIRRTAEQIINASMELGGNDPFIVLDDADLDAAVEGAINAKMRNGGQACTAANRFLVQNTIAEEFAHKLADRMQTLQVGPSSRTDTQLGPMINRRAVDGIIDKVDRTVADGARLILGGEPLDRAGFYYPATVLTNVPRDSALATEEVFGPVAPIITVRDEEDAIALANESEMGLAGYVYTSLERGLRISERLELGMVALNRGQLSDAAAPFGGMKQSGLGREGGYEGIDEYLETTYVAAGW
jgi:succinate-semialdehyde dehydrogenase / glutarate-semialdehyde dehydrogenase